MPIAVNLKTNLLSRLTSVLAFMLCILMTACSVRNSETNGINEGFAFDIRESESGWESFFTNYNVDNEEGMELQSDYRQLPEPLRTSDRGLYISAVNQSDDVKMMFRRQITGLEPNATYEVQFRIRFATSVPSGCVGIGGPPGEAVRVIADASTIKPEAIVEDGYYLLNTQQMDGADSWYQNVQLGNIANSRECEDGYEYEIKELESDPAHVTVTTNDDGASWLMFGTRSGFEGQTELYYTLFEADFRRD